jgi:cytochrome c551/c552
MERIDMKQVSSMAAILLLLLLCVACGSETEASAAATPSVPTLAPTATSAAPTLQAAELVTVPVTISPTITVSTTTISTDVPTDVPTDTVTTTVASADSGLPASIAALLPTADPVRGSELALQNGCSACHSLDEGVKVVGPSWYDLGNHAATRVAGESAPLYLYNSIVLPNQYILEGFLANLMPQTYADQLSEQEMADLIAYLLTLRAN